MMVSKMSLTGKTNRKHQWGERNVFCHMMMRDNHRIP
eukprot:CAMPEP_0203679864 /NCGR_PEP_ID=MMETSP0090-20130426/37288_1 /ASSEMBLY_ACC=CAM_ASM_001088 /TAXON_ID=426623 /ORGANISM="Chaetoceros affinis, Strain CCMP159" /LENGTH=36 /DNA_ID= /DNA_START= /DNA_END= /DNA_ORIENTATION=